MRTWKSSSNVFKIPYIYFMANRKRRAGEAGPERFLLRQGEKPIYENAEPSADRSKGYHSAVFVGCDEHGAIGLL